MKRYNLKKLYAVAQKYKEKARKFKKKNAIVTLDPDNKNAFYSLAPLSLALSELDIDIYVVASKGKNSTLDILRDIWTTYSNMESGFVDSRTKALTQFLQVVEKPLQGHMRELISPPEVFLSAGKEGFFGSFEVKYNLTWMKEFMSKGLRETGNIIWNHVYDLKKEERVKINFELLKKRKDMHLPIEDYLDSFQISYAMKCALKNENVFTMSSSSSRKSQLEKPERISDLFATLMGLELCKDSSEKIFKEYRKLSNKLNIGRMEIASAFFGIRGEGYGGRHLFGERVGYPSKGGKTRWTNPSQMILKLDFYPQTKIDTREPLARIAFTETLPIEVFVKTCNIDWLAMQKRDHKIMAIMEKCDYVIVKGKKIKNYQTDLKVELTSKTSRRHFRPSDVETRTIIHQRFLKRTGKKAGTMSNLPGGEAYVTPEKVFGTFIGDVVISIDRSYRLSGKKPFVVKCSGNNYRVVEAPKLIKSAFMQKKKEARKLLLSHEKNKSIPSNVLEISKKNFNNIGEFAINTNPNAEICDYLIVNEKIANMIHLALGSGFDADRSTYYHTDIVIDSPRQELDIYGVDKNGKKYWIHKKGRFVI